MVTPDNNEVKPFPPEDEEECPPRGLDKTLIEFIDTHPRTGWYLAGLMVFNTIINILELFT